MYIKEGSDILRHYIERFIKAMTEVSDLETNMVIYAF